MSFEEAVHQTASKDQFSTYDRTGRLQEVQAFRFVLADKLTIAVTNAGCFTDAVELLSTCFFVFNVQYCRRTIYVYYFYCFIEQILQPPWSFPNSFVLADFSRMLANHLPNLSC